MFLCICICELGVSTVVCVSVYMNVWHLNVLFLMPPSYFRKFSRSCPIRLFQRANHLKHEIFMYCKTIFFLTERSKFKK